MKNAFLVALLVLGFATAAQAFPGATQMKQNYESCKNSDESWFLRWGTYVVAFDRNEALKVCSAQYGFGYAQTRLTSCKVDGNWVYAGYYCEDIYTASGE